MSKRNLSSEEISILLKNENVSKCSNKTISFSKEFKVKALKQYEEGLSSNEIFKRAGFDLDMIGKNTPKDRLLDWRAVFKAKGLEGLTEETRGKGSPGRPKTKYETDTEKIEYLEAKVAYLDAENDFLARMRGIRRG